MYDFSVQAAISSARSRGKSEIPRAEGAKKGQHQYTPAFRGPLHLRQHAGITALSPRAAMRYLLSMHMTPRKAVDMLSA